MWWDVDTVQIFIGIITFNALMLVPWLPEIINRITIYRAREKYLYQTDSIVRIIDVFGLFIRVKSKLMKWQCGKNNNK